MVEAPGDARLLTVSVLSAECELTAARTFCLTGPYCETCNSCKNCSRIAFCLTENTLNFHYKHRSVNAAQTNNGRYSESNLVHAPAGLTLESCAFCRHGTYLCIYVWVSTQIVTVSHIRFWIIVLLFCHLIYVIKFYVKRNLNCE